LVLLSGLCYHVGDALAADSANADGMASAGNRKAVVASLMTPRQRRHGIVRQTYFRRQGSAAVHSFTEFAIRASN
jgi:hypothetical protein